MHGGLSPDLQSMEQIRRVMRPTDVPDTGQHPSVLAFPFFIGPESLTPPHLTGLLCDLLWSDPDKDITGWSENDRGVSFTFGPDVVSRFLQKHDMDLICRAHQVGTPSFVTLIVGSCEMRRVFVVGRRLLSGGITGLPLQRTFSECILGGARYAAFRVIPGIPPSIHFRVDIDSGIPRDWPANISCP